uniref:RB1-inducible coiled-coil protein 1 n=1 Tax=Ixodes ricinus TaxID=34613 RepID=A0A131XVB8_IXORI
MLYVFLVDTGKMMTFDMNHAVESVKNLKEVIAQRCHVPPDKQVLLISGGESLQLSASVGKYSAGTDTNPIFLFNKASIESDALSRSGDQSVLSDDDMQDGVEEVLNLPPSYNTVVTRTQLAQEFYERARRETKACEMLVHDQHLQQQGWAAVVANLEDTTAAFRNSAATFEQSFVEFLRNKPQHTALLESFERDLELLSKIPVLPALLSSKPMQETSSFMLLDWIHSQDSQTTLDKVAAQCVQSLKQLNDATLEKVKADVESTLASVDNPTMKEIKGLEERLYGLEDLMHKAQRLVQDQQELAQAFAQNQARASHLKDPSIFPDLCSSHIKQLKMILANHQQLRDIRRRCTAAKNELSENLNSRLRWIIYVEKAIHEVNLRMVFYSETAKRLCRHLEVFRQVHLAPHVYLHAVAEVVRRRNFSLHFLEWAGSLSSHCQKLHQNEVETRNAFNSQFSKHFLRALFPGMQDLPPPFATRNPKPFDDHLPPLASEDLELLRNTLPNLPELSDLLVSVALPAFPEVPLRSSCGSVDAPPGEASSEMRSCGPSSQCEMRSPENDGLKDSTLQASQTGSREGCRDHSESDDHERTPKLAESDDEFEEVCETPASAARAEETPLDRGRQDVVVQSPDSLGHASQDFMTADFYIDESMPSSYSDSNGLAPASGAPPASLARGPHDAVAAELQRQLEEKIAALSSTQRDLEQERARRQELRRRLCGLREVAAVVCASSRSDVASLRQDLEAARRMLSDHACQMGSAVDDALQALLARAERDQAQAVAAEVERVHRECRSSDEELRHQLEVERLKLEDAHREVHLYQQQLQQLSQLVDSLRHDSALALTSLRSTLQQEHESVLAKMVLEHELEQESTLERLRAFQKSHEEEVQDLNECICERDRQIQMLFVEHQGLENRLNAHYILDKDELLAQCQQEFAKREQELRDELAKLHQQEIDRLQRCHEEAIQKAIDDTRLKMQQEWEESQSKEKDTIEDVVDTSSSDADRHANELKSLCRKYEEQISFMKANMEAVHCRLLEEAISRAIHDKDEELSRIQGRCDELTRLLEQNKGLGGTAESLDQEDNNPSTELVSQMQLGVPCSQADDPNGASMMESTVRLPQQADPFRDLRNQLMCKEQEVSRLQQKMMAMSDTFGTQPLSLPTDKVSVLTCSAGDVVLLCFDEGHQNYVLFVLGPVLHFLHTDCLETLGLQTAPGAIRKGWVLAEVLEKEYCQARKSQNRYRVPAGTRFYRVKCKLWDKEAAMRREHQRRHSLRGLTTTTSMLSEESSAQGNVSAPGEPFSPQDAPLQFPMP